MQISKYELKADKLRWQCDPKIFKFECTKDLTPQRQFIGQDRALRAFEFGLSMQEQGYNIYVAGPVGGGKTAISKSYIEDYAKERQEKGEVFYIEDWCYVYNFVDQDRPEIVNLPRGMGKQFKANLTALRDGLKRSLKKAFSGEDYALRRKQLVDEGQALQESIFQALAEETRAQKFLFQMTATGPNLIPMVDNKPMEQSEFLALSDDERKEWESSRSILLKKVQEKFEGATNIEKDTGEKIKQLDREVGETIVSWLFAPLIGDHADLEKITAFLAELKTYTLDHLDSFFRDDQLNPALGVPNYMLQGRDPFMPFRVNVFVDNSSIEGVPIILENNPNFGNLFGKMERRFLFGGYLSDHTLLKPGAMSLANGGYLLLDAMDVISNPGVWPALKRALKNKEVCIEDPFEQFGMVGPQGIKPEPMPIDVKLLLIGDQRLYQLLSTYDEDFGEIFKVKADFDSEIENNEGNLLNYAAFIAGSCEDSNSRHFDPTGLSKIMEYSARMVADQERLSSRFVKVQELAAESNHWAGLDGASVISAKHVQQAHNEKVFRHNLLDYKMRDMITRGTIMIDADGDVVGQVNGLAVYAMGDIAFGKPSRITAKTYLGRGGVINIERESHLSGNIHDKGVMILSGYMGAKYAQDQPLSLTASLCFEQSYDEIDGDSASSVELYAILSSLSGIPLKQNIAVTGSVNQQGEVQPIGGVNHKIEGFYDVCNAMGLTGDQGVMIPVRNLKNLMLREDIVEAVRKKKFHIYAVSTIDEGISILTGVDAGARLKTGNYPKNSVNFHVDKQLKDMAKRLKGFQNDEKKESQKRASSNRKKGGATKTKSSI